VSRASLIIRGGEVVASGGVARRDVAVADGAFAEIGDLDGWTAEQEIDASGLMVLPGFVDAHVHFNEPGRAHWEGFATGSMALAAGGGTCFIDMPLNAAPPTIDRESFELKRAAGEASSLLDFALWGGLVPGNHDKLEELRDCGVVGFKAFMIDSGTADFPGVVTAELRDGMKIAARLGLPVAVHAEDAEMILERTGRLMRQGRKDAKAFLESRPVESEVAAVRTAVELAGETGCALHIVHASCPEAVAVVADGKARGVDVTVEVCPHHLLLTEDDVGRIGAQAKCAPPLRDEARRKAMWQAVRDGEIDTMGSDHSPAPPMMKVSDDFFAVWGGIMGCQHAFLLAMTAALDVEGIELARTAQLLARNPAERFGLGGRKGEIAPGKDADFVLLRRQRSGPIRAESLIYRHKTSPYVGLELGLEVCGVARRGEIVCPGGLHRVGGRFLSRE
jgi:allantoinase